MFLNFKSGFYDFSFSVALPDSKMTPQHLVETGLLPRGESGPDSLRLKTAPEGQGEEGSLFDMWGNVG